jgi:hypothetical protein
MTGLTYIHQCPRCELRFTSSSEMQQHLRDDHRPRPPVEERPVHVPTRTLTPEVPARMPGNAVTRAHGRRYSGAILLAAGAVCIVLAGFLTSTSTMLIVIGLVLALAGCYGLLAHARTRFRDADNQRRAAIREPDPDGQVDARNRANARTKR